MNSLLAMAAAVLAAFLSLSDLRDGSAGHWVQPPLMALIR